MSKRLEDWPSRLLALVEERKGEPFEWGRMDCCLFACDCVQAMTGVDPAASFRGYTDREGAAEVIARFGSLEALVVSQCAEQGFEELPAVLLAQRGDLVLFDNAGNPALGICVGGTVAFTGANGLEFHPLGVCRRAWRVG